jgi:hypothetical protein
MCGVVSPQLILGCWWYAPLLTHSVNTQLALCGALWCYWSAVGCDGRATCSWSRLTALLLGDCWECACSSLRLAWWGVLFSEAPLKSSPTCSCWWLRYGLQNVPREHANCTAGMRVLTGRGHLADCGVFHVCFSVFLSGGEIPYVLLSGLPRKPLVTIPVLLRLLVTAVILSIELLLRYRFG